VVISDRGSGTVNQVMMAIKCLSKCRLELN